jgi:hypothetical protein
MSSDQPSYRIVASQVTTHQRMTPAGTWGPQRRHCAMHGQRVGHEHYHEGVIELTTAILADGSVQYEYQDDTIVVSLRADFDWAFCSYTCLRAWAARRLKQGEK